MYKKKILHIITSLGDGGAEGVLYRLITNSPQDYHHEVIALSVDRKYENLLREKKIKVYNINLLKNKFEIKKLINLYKIIKQKKNYIIQTWLYHSDFLGGLCAYLSGNRNIFWNIRTSEISLKSTKLKTLLIIYLNAFLSWFIPKKIIICSQRSIKVHRLVGYKNNFKLIHNGFDNRIFEKSKSYKRKLFKLNNKQILIGNVARYHSVKNHEYLFLIFSKLQKNLDIKLILAGTNMDERNKDLMKMIDRYKIRDKVILLGRRDDIMKIYKIFDIFILTSLSEGFPNVLAEAMINNNICFSTNVGDSDVILRNKSFMIPHNNHKKVVKVIKKIIDKKNSKEWKMIKEKNKEHIVSHFSLNKMTNRYLNVWRS